MANTSREQINKLAWTIAESIKDALSSNLSDMIKAGHIKLDNNAVLLLLNVANSSVEEGFHRCNKVFMKGVDVALENVEPPTKKKK